MMLAPRPQRVTSDPDILVTGWMEDNATALHPAFRQHGGYEDQRAEVRKMRSQADGVTLDFCNILKCYQHNLSSKPLKGIGTINLHEAHTWEEVMLAARAAESAYHAKASRALGFTGQVRRFFRLAGDYAPSTQPWTGLLPNDSYMSVVCGGLKLVFQVAAKRSETRSKILETFDHLPDMVLRTQRCHELFPGNLILRDRALAVYVNLLSMIEAMLSTLLEKKFLDRIKDGLKGPLAEKNLDERTRLFNTSMADLEGQVQYLHLQSSQEAHGMVEQMLPRVQRTETLATRSYLTTSTMGKDVKNIGHYLEGMSERNEAIGSQVSDLHSSAGIIEAGLSRLQKRLSVQQTLTWNMNKRLEANTQATEQLTSMLQDVLQAATWRDEKLTQRLAYQSQALSSQHQGEMRMFQKGVLSLLDVNLENDTPRLETVMRVAQFIDQQEQGRAQFALKTTLFKSFVQSHESSVLLLNGNGTDGMTRWSSMSLLSALLAHSLSQNDQQTGVYVLPFFCGHHNSFSDDVVGPKGLMRVLLSQLLGMYNFDLGFIRFGSWYEGLQAHDLTTLSRLFHRLLTQLPHITVITIIDGISLFETSRWEADLTPVLRRLMGCVTDDNLDCTLKVLFTSPTVSRQVRDVIGTANTLSIPSGMNGSGSLLTDRMMSRSLTPSPRMEGGGLGNTMGTNFEHQWIPGGRE